MKNYPTEALGGLLQFCNANIGRIITKICAAYVEITIYFSFGLSEVYG